MTNSENPKITYHLRELEIAKNPDSPAHVMPRFSDEDQSILDIGCGIGQTFVAAHLDNNRLLVGLDIDLDSVVYGRRQFDHINFVNATAEILPFQSESFDCVISRVTLPCTNLPIALLEIRRVLRTSGKIWMTLHTISKPLNHMKESLLNGEIKDVFFRTYVILSGIYLHLFGRLFPFPLSKRYESFQTESGVMRLLKTAQFTSVKISRDRHFVVTAQKGA